VYFRVAGEAYALVSIGLISFAAVAQFAPALLGGMYWKGGTQRGALAGLLAGFALWSYTLMLPSVAKSGWLPAGFLHHGPFGITLLKPEQLLGLAALDNLTHSLFWSLLANIGAYVAVSLWRAPSARETSQALLFVDVFERTQAVSGSPVFWRGRARVQDLLPLAGRLLGSARANELFDAYARKVGAARIEEIPPDAQLVQFVEMQLAGAIGSASARVMVASVVQEEALALDDVMRILDEASQLRAYSRALEEKSLSLERATAELRAANEQLKSLDQLKDDFMSSVTHELRTPLTSIRALSELMVDDAGMEPAQRMQFLSIIVGETERLGRLVNQVLDMAKIESGHAEWHNSDVDMRALVQQAVQSTLPLVQQHGGTIALEMHEAVPAIRADHDRLMQVMLNLLSNAAKFLPPENGRVTVTLRTDDEGLSVTVRDNGPGVPEAEQALVFEKFRQGAQPPPGRSQGGCHPPGGQERSDVGANMTNRRQGTGLGLPISREIVEHFGGTMWLHSKPGEGASFGFRLPWQQPGGATAAGPPPRQLPPPRGAGAERRGGEQEHNR
jgi:signal transduction histidine kinase